MIIHLTRGYQVMVSAEDYQMLVQYAWEACVRKDGSVYAIRRFTQEGKRVKLYMHRVITKCPPGLVVDHINGIWFNELACTLDNRRQNLRICTEEDNRQNCAGFGEVGYRGVVKNGSGNFRARFGKGGWLSLGTFKTAIEAARAYDLKALEIYGPFARTNLPRDNYPEAEQAKGHDEPDPVDIPF